MEVRLLLPGEIAGWYPRLEPFIANVAARSGGRYATEHLFAWAISGEWQLWVVIEDGWITCVVGTEILNFPTGLKCLAWRFCTGRGYRRWLHRIGDVLAWGKAQGCTRSEGLFRPGWKRILLVLGWRCTHVLLEREIR